jgi:hypothetical protein
LLVGSRLEMKSENFLHIYDTEGRHVLSVKNIANSHWLVVRDAIWTPQGNIVCAIGTVINAYNGGDCTRTGDIVATN